MNRTLEELARAMLNAKRLPEYLWEYSILHAAYIRNRSYTKHLENETPYEGWNGKKPNVAHLREFGAPVWVLLQGEKRDRKMLPKSRQHVYVGFDDGAKAVLYYNSETRKILTSRNHELINPPEVPEPTEPVVITPHTPDTLHTGEPGERVMQRSGIPTENRATPNNERRLYVGAKPIHRKRKLPDNETAEPDKDSQGRTDDRTTKRPRTRSDKANPISEGVSASKSRTDDQAKDKSRRARRHVADPNSEGESANERTDDIEAMNKSRKTRGVRRDYRHIANPFSEGQSANETIDTLHETYAIIAGDEITSLREAKQSEDWPEWEAAMGDELQLLTEKGTWELVEKPVGATLIPNKWTFLKKRNKEGDVVRHKARLVVKGCAQRPGYDYIETYSPVVRVDSLRAILALVPVKGLQVQQMDVKGAYLNGILQETIYMKQPKGCEDGTTKVCKLVKTLYGLKQAGREWNKQLDEELRKFDYKRLVSDPCVYVRWVGEECAIITVWVDDLMLFASNDKMMRHMKKTIKSRWEATDLGEPAKIIGIEISTRRDQISISQTKYIESILRNEGMNDANPVGMPMDPNVKLEPNPEANTPNRSNAYAKLLGELQYVANCTRPDISYTVNRLAAYTANPSLQHYGAVKRVLRYLAGTRNLAITYQKISDETNDDSMQLHGYSDAAYANTDDLKSTMGYVFLASEGAITWKSKKQSVIVLSTTESEYIALSEAGREAIWLRNLYGELGFPQKTGTVIKGDNDGSIILSRNPQFHQRSKHIAIRYHWIRDQVNDKLLDIQSCRDAEQTADILTKALPKPKHTQHTREMGLDDTR